MVKLGYEIERESEDGTFELKGYEREQIEAFSKRRQQIEQALEEKGLSSAEAAAMACLDTRKKKEEVSKEDVRREWRQRAAKLGINLEKPREIDRRVDGREPRPEAASRYAVLAMEHLEERSSVFDHADILRHCLERGTGSVTLGHVERAIESLVAEKKLIPVGSPDFKQYTTDRALELERRILSLSKAGRGACEPILDDGEALAGIEKLQERSDGLVYTRGQREAVRMILTARDRVVGVQGYAGTGKTTMLEAVKRLSEAEGFEVRGFSPTAAAAEQLERETGIECDTLSMHLLATGNRVVKGHQLLRS